MTADQTLAAALVDLGEEILRQDAKYGPFEGTRLARSRLALACLDDELREAVEAWRDERRAPVWDEARTEVLQVAAVAIRAIRDAFTDDDLEGSLA